MATVEIICPHCNRKQKVAEHRLAETVHCLVCQQLISDVYLHKVEPPKPELNIKLKGRLVSEFGTTKLEDLKSRADGYTGKFEPVDDEQEDDTGLEDTGRMFDSGMYTAMPGSSHRKLSTAAKTYLVGGAIMLVLAIGVTILGVALIKNDDGKTDTIDAAGSEGMRVERYPNGQKKTEWHVSRINGEGVPDGTWLEWYETGERKLQGSYVQGVKSGTWTGWHENGQQSLEASYSDDLEDGTWTEWHSNGQKAVAGTYKAGKKDGEWRTWYPSGALESAEQYEDGKPVGQWVRWYENRVRKLLGEYVNGMREGPWVSYHDNGLEDLSENWRLGVLDGETHATYRNRQRKFEGRWDKGQRAGQWTWWHTNGDMAKQGSYANGLEQGQWHEWYPGNILKVEGAYQDGQRINEWHWYDEDGNLATRRVYEQGRQTTEVWFFRGTEVKHMTELYEDGTLHREWTVQRAEDGTEFKQGYQREFFPDGSRKERGLYMNGQKEGLWQTWDEVGNLLTEVTYKAGQPQ